MAYGIHAFLALLATKPTIFIRSLGKEANLRFLPVILGILANYKV
jgi:hypothetical protein